jgi:two-component system chemotaxis family response regulator WspR
VVLVVDDQPFVGQVLSRLLASEQDLEVHCCLRAADAVAMAISIAPAVILQDLVMPHMDGLTVLAALRENPATARTPVIVMSGNDDAETRDRALSAGAVDFMVKLPGKRELLDRIRRASDGTRNRE